MVFASTMRPSGIIASADIHRQFQHLDVLAFLGEAAAAADAHRSFIFGAVLPAPATVA